MKALETVPTTTVTDRVSKFGQVAKIADFGLKLGKVLGSGRHTPHLNPTFVGVALPPPLPSPGSS